jgi:hypothetical protein
MTVTTVVTINIVPTAFSLAPKLSNKRGIMNVRPYAPTYINVAVKKEQRLGCGTYVRPIMVSNFTLCPVSALHKRIPVDERPEKRKKPHQQGRAF